MGHVTESIFAGSSATIPMAEVSHVNKAYAVDYRNTNNPKATHNGYKVIFKHSKWHGPSQDFEPNVFLCLNEGLEFLQAWCQFRHELEFETLSPPPQE